MAKEGEVHKTDKPKLPNEDAITDAIRNAGIPPGDYLFPRAEDPKEDWSEGQMEKYKRGPVGIMTVMPSGPPNMKRSLLLWFLFCVMVSVFTAYITAQAVPAGGDYLQVFRIAGATSFLAYGFLTSHDTIWWYTKWSTTIKFVFDGLVYALITAGVFGWLWH